ncbi:MAG: aspartyl/asparaginyl beta-hydroxylase (cupin superfamily) [Gammaproteobacteria bacterium]|jgi:aspartyl/asparaginyl beta-hydroxylase (cupin superfamily)
MNTPHKKKQRPIIAIGLWIIKRVEKILIHYSIVGNAPFFDPEDFSWTSSLEAQWQTIRKELDLILQHPERVPNFQDISKDQINISNDDLWKTFFLYGYGYKEDKNCKLCPETTRIVEEIPGMMTAFFSVLAPGKIIPPHRGPYKGLLRCHLALKVPEPKEQCWIQVDEKIENWEEGKCLVFDDTYSHNVHNNTDGSRVVLFLDIVRPVRFPGSILNRIILRLIQWSPYIQDARKNQRTWEYKIGNN